MSRTSSVGALLASFKVDAPQVEEHDADARLVEIREVLSEGLDGTSDDELDAYAVLAERFGLYADAWNALTLRRPSSAIPVSLRGVGLRAFFALFPNVARERPEIAVAIAKGDGATVGGDVLVDALAYWCRRMDQRRDEDVDVLGRSLVSMLDVLDAVHGRELEASELPHDFISDFVALALSVAEGLDHDVDRMGRLGLVLARALSWSVALREIEASDPTTPMFEDLPAVEGHDGAGELDSKVDEESLSAGSSRSDGERGGTRDGVLAPLREGRRRIVVIGGLAAPWSHLVGIAKKMGISESSLKHYDYDQLKSRGVHGIVNIATDAGVLIGPVPHKAAGVGHHSSPVQQAKSELGLPVVELREKTAKATLKISKSSFRDGLEALLRELAVRDRETDAMAAA